MSAYGVVIPAWNAEKTLAEAIESVLAQDCKPIQIIVVDDGSTDSTAKIAKAFGPDVQLIQQTNQGPGSATSKGMKNIDAEYIALLDADDLWLAEKCSTQLKYLQEYPEVQLVHTLMRQFNHHDPERKLGPIRRGPIRSNVFFHRKVYETVGNIIDPPGNCGDMVDWFARSREAGFTDHYIDQTLALRRIIPGSMTSGRNPENGRGYLNVVRQAMLRKREQAKNG